MADSLATSYMLIPDQDALPRGYVSAKPNLGRMVSVTAGDRENCSCIKRFK